MIKKIINYFCLYIFLFLLKKNIPQEKNVIEKSELILLDGIAAIRIGSSGLTPTYYSDAWFLSPFGKMRTLSDIIIENFWISYGNEHGIKIVSNESSSEYAEQYLDMMQTQKNISRKDIAKIAEENGYTFNDIKKELNRQYLIQQTIETHFAANSLLTISSSEILEYYNNLGIKTTNLYIIRIGSLNVKEYNSKNTPKIKDYIEKNYQKILWEEPYKIREEELNENFRKKDNLIAGEIIHYEKNSKGNSFLIYELVSVNEETQSKADLYDTITKQLQQKKYQESLNYVTKNFLNSSTIKYDTEEIKENCMKTFAE